MNPADAASSLELQAAHACFGGEQRFYSHDSVEIGLPMRFALYLPPQASSGPLPAVLYLAGLTCNEETFPIKAGAQRVAAELGLALIAPDTSPRGAGIDGETDCWDFGVGAGFYLDATEPPWSTHWRMESYLIQELLPLLAAQGFIQRARVGICGHSMGGHGALTLALRHPGVFRSLSALAPICAPTRCPWGNKAFSGYLGDDHARWEAHDTCALLRQRQRQDLGAPYPDGILVDQGLADKFLDEQLHPHLLEQACRELDQPLQLRRHAGYDHGYYFIASHIEDHLRHHHTRLLG